MNKAKKHVIRLKAATKSTHWVDNMHFSNRLVIRLHEALKEVDLIKQGLITPITIDEFLAKL
jgi:hypothetical protein